MTERTLPTTLTLPTDRTIVMTRLFDAPRHLVFKAYTDPAAIPHWWGPRRLTTTVVKMDVRPGGEWRYVQRDAEGHTFLFSGVYQEVAPPERLVSTFEWDGMPGRAVLDTAVFEDLGGQTRLTTTSLFQTSAERDDMLNSGMEGGAVETWDRLAEHLAALQAGTLAPEPAGTRTLTIRRVFKAPRALLYQAFTQPERVKQWWGPKGFTAPTCQIDLRVGGRYLFCMRSPEGQDFWSTGVYREIVPGERLVYADSFADEHGNVVPASHYGLPGDFPPEMLVTVTFEDAGPGQTRVTLEQAGHPAGQMADLAEAGWLQQFDKLETILE